MLPGFIDKAVLPHRSGIYIYKDGRGQILYVGKAVDLYSRVSSYFSSRSALPKTARLVEQIRSVETIVVESELQALILEANLIKRHLPPYNVKLTDDKDYLYIGITREDFPKVITARKNELKQLKKYFGPFPSAKILRDTLKKLRRVFPWCLSPAGGKNRSGKPCFYYHLGLCPGACAGLIDKKAYNRIIARFAKFLEGKQDELTSELTKEMQSLAKLRRFEEAEQIKKVLLGINYLLQPTKIEQYLANPNFLEDINREAMAQLQKDLKLPRLPERIEGYDISNLQGDDATGSMVVLTQGETDKSQYRRFKIKITGKPDDFAMHREMMRRRLKHTDWPLPQLFLVDGGRGQVRAAKAELDRAGVTVPVYGLAKRMEWLYPPEGEAVRLPKRSLSLRLLQKIRDESHRFAISYHRLLRSRRFLGR